MLQIKEFIRKYPTNIFWGVTVFSLLSSGYLYLYFNNDFGWIQLSSDVDALSLSLFSSSYRGVIKIIHAFSASWVTAPILGYIPRIIFMFIISLFTIDDDEYVPKSVESGSTMNFLRFHSSSTLILFCTLLFSHVVVISAYMYEDVYIYFTPRMVKYRLMEMAWIIFYSGVVIFSIKIFVLSNDD